MDCKSIFSVSLKAFALFCGLALATGCASTHSSSQAFSTSSNDEAAAKLAEAATSISQSLTELQGIQKAAIPVKTYKPLVDPQSFAMAELVSVDWSGPAAPLLQKIADASHYRLRVLGVQPAIPVLVSITAKNTPLADIIRDLDFQCGKQANIAVYPATRIIELRYAKA
jgi:defect-in-organelle-trafficking protein DotD